MPILVPLPGLFLLQDGAYGPPGKHDSQVNRGRVACLCEEQFDGTFPAPTKPLELFDRARAVKVTLVQEALELQDGYDLAVDGDACVRVVAVEDRQLNFHAANPRLEEED